MKVSRKVGEYDLLVRYKLGVFIKNEELTDIGTPYGCFDLSFEQAEKAKEKLLKNPNVTDVKIMKRSDILKSFLGGENG